MPSPYTYNVGKHSGQIHLYLSEKQVTIEKERPVRKNFREFAYMNIYSEKN
jgi:hypothetical protein